MRIRSASPRAALPLLCAALLLAACGRDPGDVRNLRAPGDVIVVLGDSLTQGVGAGPGEDFPSVLARELGRPVINAGRSGDRTDGALRRLQKEVLDLHPRLVVVAIGGNDFLSQIPRDEAEANLTEIVRRAQEGGAMVAVVGYRFHILADLRKSAKRIAGEQGAWYVADPLEGLFDNPAYKSDQLHLNAAGYEEMGRRVAEGLRPLLEAADRARGGR